MVLWVTSPQPKQAKKKRTSKTTIRENQKQARQSKRKTKGRGGLDGVIREWPLSREDNVILTSCIPTIKIAKVVQNYVSKLPVHPVSGLPQKAK